MPKTEPVSKQGDVSPAAIGCRSITMIEYNRPAGVRERHPNLVSAAGPQADSQKGAVRVRIMADRFIREC